MIKRLRARFIRIATLSVAVVMLLLTVAVNAANFISTDSDLTETLELICGNEGTIPLPAQGPAPGASGEETAPNSSRRGGWLRYGRRLRHIRRGNIPGRLRQRRTLPGASPSGCGKRPRRRTAGRCGRSSARSRRSAARRAVHGRNALFHPLFRPAL